MTTATKMHGACEALEKQIAEIGYASPQVAIHINWLSRPFCVHIEHKSAQGVAGQSEFLKGDTMAEAMEKADAYVADLPSVEAARMRDFTHALGRLIDQGREIGVDVDYINPLTKMMENLAENAITDQSEDQPERQPAPSDREGW